jgi:1-acyl-sn-glycerol-3-phosphate acyltransferase
VWYAVARAIVYTACWLVWRLEIVGRENVPKEQPYVLAPVHRSYIDSMFAGCVSPRRPRFMAKSGVFDRPLAGKLYSSLGSFPVRRGTPDREALALCEQALVAGEPVVLFPEGTRAAGPVLKQLLRGPAFLALRANVPIVPVGIGGSEKAMPVGAKWVHRARISVVVGKPIWPPPKSDSGRVPRRMIDDMTERLRSELQALFDEAMARAERSRSGTAAAGAGTTGTAAAGAATTGTATTGTATTGTATTGTATTGTATTGTGPEGRRP